MKRPFVEYAMMILAVILFWAGSMPQKPKVFVIGDSISLFYGPYLQQKLSGVLIYDRKGGRGDAFEDLDNPAGANGGDSQRVLDYLKELQANGNFKTDYFLINCGLHDIKHTRKGDSSQVSLTDYEENLREIVAITRQMQTKLIWVSTTPVVDSVHNSRVPFFRFDSDVVKYNKVADSIMNIAKVPVIDLYTFTIKYIPEGYMDHVHYNDEVRKAQADFIAENLLEIVKLQ